MSSKDNVKFKYRIVVNDSTDYPFLVERKGWIFWKSFSKERDIDHAKETILKCARQEMLRPGKVVFEYNEDDYLVDKLKGNQRE
jgi:hypothetical protein